MKYILPIIIVLFFISCKDKKVPDNKFSAQQIKQLKLNNIKSLQVLEQGKTKLDLNQFLSEKEIFIDDLIDSIQYIPLETTNESLIAEVNKLVCSETNFFILDADIGKNVFIFSKEGDFIKKISVGMGPEEIYHPEDIAIDEHLGHLIVYNRKGLSFYDYRGNFIKRDPVPFNFANFRVLPYGYLFVMNPNRNNHLERVADMQLLITDKNFRIISAGLPFHYSEKNQYEITDYTNSFDEKVYFSFKFSSKIYQYVDSLSVQEKYQLDFLQKELPSNYLEMGTNELLNVLKNNDYFYFMGEFVENKTHQYLSLYNRYNKNSKTFIFRNKKSGEISGANSVLLSEKVPLFGHPLASFKNKFIGVINSNSINQYYSSNKNGKDNLPIDKLSEDLNPVLISYTLKMSR